MFALPLTIAVNEVCVDEEPIFLIRMKSQQKIKALLNATDVVNVLSEVFCKKGVLKNFTNFTGKRLCQSLFFIKKEALAQVFSGEFCEIFNDTFFIEHLQWLPLNMDKNKECLCCHEVKAVEFFE